MLLKKNKKPNNRRRSSNNIGSDFRRNSVVISTKQREVAAHKQSVTQRQVDNKKRRQSQLKKRRIILISFLALSVLIVLRYQVTGYDTKSDAKIKLSAQQKIEYSSAMLEYSSSHTPLKQQYLLDKTGLLLDVSKKHPEIRQVTLSARQPFSTKVQAKLSFRKPIFLWNGVGETYFIDKEGVLFTKNMYKNLSEKNLPVIEDQGGVAPDPGQTVLTDTIVTDIAKLYQLMPEVYPQSVKVSQIILPPAAREIRAKLDGVPYYVKFSTERPIEDQIGELKQVVSHLNSNKVTPGEYIDVRVVNKVFYK